MSSLLTNNEGLALFAGKRPKREGRSSGEESQGSPQNKPKNTKVQKIRVDFSFLNSFIFVIFSLLNVPKYFEKKTSALLFLDINAHDFFLVSRA